MWSGDFRLMSKASIPYVMGGDIYLKGLSQMKYALQKHNRPMTKASFWIGQEVFEKKT